MKINESSDSSMDDKDIFPFVPTAVYSSVQIPLWTIRTNTDDLKLRNRPVQIPLWTIRTHFIFGVTKYKLGVQIPLWTIRTRGGCRRVVGFRRSDSSMDDKDSGGGQRVCGAV